MFHLQPSLLWGTLSMNNNRTVMAIILAALRSSQTKLRTCTFVQRKPEERDADLF